MLCVQASHVHLTVPTKRGWLHFYVRYGTLPKQAGSSSTRMDATTPATDIYCGDQLKVPAALPTILKDYTKAVIRANPDDINAFSLA